MTEREQVKLKKEQLRKEIKAKLKSADPKDLQKSADLINQSLAQFLESKLTLSSPVALLIYSAKYKGEVDLTPTETKFSKLLQIYLPCCQLEEMIFKLKDEQLTRGKFGIDEPTSSQKFSASNFDLTILLVPGLAFDLYGNRLGRGLGYYDRVLDGLKKICTPKLITIGITLNLQIIPSVPTEVFDQKVDYLICESGLIPVKELT